MNPNAAGSDASFEASIVVFDALNVMFDASNEALDASSVAFDAWNAIFDASNMAVDASSVAFNASSKAFDASNALLKATIHCVHGPSDDSPGGFPLSDRKEESLRAESDEHDSKTQIRKQGVFQGWPSARAPVLSGVLFFPIPSPVLGFAPARARANLPPCACVHERL